MKTRYVYFPTVRYVGSTVKLQKECHSLEDCFSYLSQFLRRGALYTVYVYDRKTDRDVLQPYYSKFKSKRELLNGSLLVYLRYIRLTAIKNARNGVQLPY